MARWRSSGRVRVAEALLLLAGLALGSAAHADQQRDPQLKGVIAKAITEKTGFKAEVSGTKK